MQPWVDLLIPLAGMATGVVMALGLFKTVRHFIDRKAPALADDELREEIAELHARVDALEMRGERVEELESRLDFAERLLAQRSEAGRLARGD